MSDDLYRQLEDRLVQLIQEFNAYRNVNPLENASIRKGRVRFVGGLLLIDSGGRLEIVGALDGEGVFRWVGPWEFDSPDGGRIAGDVDLAGDFDLTGKLTAGNVRIEDGKIYVGAGASQIVIDGATGKIIAGSMAIDPANGGSVTFPGGAVIKAGTGGGVEVTQGSYSAVVTSGGASIGKSGRAVAVTDAVGFQFVGLPTTSGKGVPAGTLWADGTGIVYRATS